MSKAFREKSASGMRDEKMRGAEDRNFNPSHFIDVRLRLGYIVEVTFITEWESEWDFSTPCLYSKGHGNCSTCTRVHWMEIGHFRFPKNLTFKTRLSAKPLLWNEFYLHHILKIIFISIASHLASLWKWVFWNSEMAYWWIYTQISTVIRFSPMDFFAMFTGFMIEVKLKFINDSFALRFVHM